MRRFEIIDGEKPGAVPCGILCFDEATRKFSFEVAEGAGPRDVPAMFALAVERGERQVPPRLVQAWVEERIAPVSRQNIGEILRAHGLEEYDPAVLLTSNRGRSTQDGFFLHEVGDAFTGARRLGRSVRAARLRAGLTQEELARRAGMSQEALSLLERGVGNPTMKTLERIARALGCSLEISFGEPSALGVAIEYDGRSGGRSGGRS